MISLQDIKKWIINKYGQDEQTEAENLVWLKRKADSGQTIDWDFVDTVDYDIDSIPRKKELIFDFKAKPKEVAQKCQNLLK